MRLWSLMLVLVGLTACATAVAIPEEPEFEPEPVPLFEANNPGPWCGYAARLSANPNADPSQKTAVEELARQRGC